ncbi:hypothetical protein QCA50_005033 [Cerrena zonata]|uniref:P-loop containing nucleoside triphosphate hydrolase protein n=1 Tax=Cerrena zonata TaxID=2478898 RepID=A0AAW0GIM1_9APHY
MSVCPQDNSFGPSSSCRGLDFTMYFEQTVLSFTPDVVFTVFACLRLAYLWSQTTKLARIGTIHLAAKSIALAFVLGTNIAILTFAVDIGRRGNVFVWVTSSVLQLLSSLLLIVLVIIEHFRSMTPSTLAVCYALIKCIFQAAVLRTYVKIGSESDARVLVILTTVSIASYFTLICIEIFEKRRLLRNKSLPTVSTTNVLSRLLCFWLLPLLLSGGRKSLTIDDCGEIPEEFSSKVAGDALYNALGKTSKTPSYLLKASFRAFGLAFLAPVLPRIILLLATFAQPLLVKQTISFISDPNRPLSQGWALVGGFVCVYAIIVFATSLYWEKVYNFTIQYRGALVNNVYKKSLTLSSNKSRIMGSAASTHISVDVERICQGMEFLNEIWASTLSVGLAIAILYSQATWPAFFPVVVTLGLMLIASIAGRQTGKHQTAWLAATDERVKYLSSIIHKMLPIKLSHYEKVVASRAAEYRARELHKASHFYNFIALMGGLSNVTGALCIFSVLGPYTALAASGHGSILDPDRLFTIVTTVNLLSAPLNDLGQAMPVIFAAYASIKRIQSFLLLEDQTDPDSVGEDHGAVEKPLGNSLTAIKMENASFGWTAEGEPFLHDVTLNLQIGQLHVCVGSVASGKSLLLLSILGETSKMGGEYIPPCDRIAYLPQDTFIMPGTIRQNITFGLPFEEGRYHKILDGCALFPDLARMRAGDQTLLGEKGVRLSGGQKQRIALARALYADAPWTILDDPLNAVDAKTEMQIFTCLFGKSGILTDKSVLLVTHNVQYLSSAQNVIVLDAGYIKYQGPPSNYEFSSDIITSNSVTPVESTSPDTKEEKEDMTEEEEDETPLQKSSQGLIPYAFYSRMSTWPQVSLVLISIFLVAIGEIGLQFFLRSWSTSNGKDIGTWIGGYAGITVAFLVCINFMVFLTARTITRFSGINIHRAELSGLLATAPAYFMKTSAGRIINRLSQDILITDLEFPFALLNSVWYIDVTIGTMILIVIPTPFLLLVLVPIGVLYGVVLTFYVKTSKQLQHLEAASKSPIYSMFSTTMSGIESIRSLHVQSFFQEQSDVHLDRSQKPFFFRFAGLRFLQTTLSVVTFIVAISLSSLAVGLRDTVDPAFLGLALSGLTSLSPVLGYLVKYLASVENGTVSVSRIYEIATLPAEPDVVETAELPDDWPRDGAISFENVELRYNEDQPPAVHSVSFSIAAGQKVGICGRSGSGKSSLILALLRALDSSQVSGRISVDGIDTQTLPLSVLREAFSFVAQDPFLWHATIRENLDPEGVKSDKELWEVLDRVGMHDCVSGQPDKLDTVLEDGGSLSKGQRQLLCLARVLLRRRKIVILDEAGSSLDHETAEKMREIIRTELSGCTVLAIAHQLSTIVDFDRIFVMEDGAIVESGSPDKLLSQRDSRFASLAADQGITRSDSIETTNQAG